MCVRQTQQKMYRKRSHHHLTRSAGWLICAATLSALLPGCVGSSTSNSSGAGPRSMGNGNVEAFFFSATPPGPCLCSQLDKNQYHIVKHGHVCNGGLERCATIKRRSERDLQGMSGCCCCCKCWPARSTVQKKNRFVVVAGKVICLLRINIGSFRCICIARRRWRPPLILGEPSDT